METKGYSHMAYFIAVSTMLVSGAFMAAAPIVLCLILYQGGTGTVPVYDGNTGGVSFYVNNVVAAVVFSSSIGAFSWFVFRQSRKAVADLNKQRNAA